MFRKTSLFLFVFINLFFLARSQKTTGEPAEVVVTSYKTTMVADGKETALIGISVFDKQGREVSDAQNLI